MENLRPQQTPLGQDLRETMNKLLRLNEDVLRQQRFAALGPERIFSFVYLGEEFRMFLPQGGYDYIQRNILSANGFYELRALEKLVGLNTIRPNGIVCDIGANIGNHSVFFGRYLSPSSLLAFEPQPACVETLSKNLRLNGVDAQVHPILLGAQSGQGEMSHFKQGNIGGCSFAEKAGGGITMRALDDVLAEKRDQVSFLKIDVEGAQVSVLEGAQAVIAQSRPVIWVEIMRNEWPETEALLTSLGYRSTQLVRDNYLFEPLP